MGGSSIFSLEPTFTQGLILGQLSIVVLLILVLRHLFFDSRAGRRLETPTYHPRLEEEEPEKAALNFETASAASHSAESAVWFNLILRSVREYKFIIRPMAEVAIYRCLQRIGQN
jgi:maintenance of mitochondrial morphology protein 1